MKKMLINSFYSVLGWFIPLVIMFISIPIYIKYLGNKEYGVYFLIINIVNFIGLLNFGTFDYVAKYIAEQKNKVEADINELINTSLNLNIISSLILLVLIYFNKNLILYNFIKVYNEDNTYGSVLMIISVIFLMNFLYGNFQSVLKGLEKFKSMAIINIANILVLNIGIIILMYLGYKLKAIVLYNLIEAILILVIGYFICKKSLPSFRYNFIINKLYIKDMFLYSRYSFFTAIFSAILFNSDKLFLGYYFSAELVAKYTVLANLSMKIHQFIAAATNNIFPRFSALVAKNETNKMDELLYRAFKYSIIFISIVCIPLTVYSYKIISYWLGVDYAKNSLAFILLIMAYSIYGVLCIPYYFFNGVGLTKYNFKFYFIGCIVCLALNMYLIPQYNLMGAAIATITSSLFTFLELYKAIKILDSDRKKYLKLILNIFVCGIIYYGICLILNKLINGIFMLLAVCFADAIVYLLIIYFFKVFDKSEVIFLKVAYFKILKIKNRGENK